MAEKKKIAPTEEKLQLYKKIVDQYFINGHNKVQAAKAFKEFSTRQAANKFFNRMLEHQEVQDYMIEKHADIQERLDISTNEMIDKLRYWIDADYTEFLSLSEDEIKKLPIELKRLMSGFKKKETTFENGESNQFEITFMDKTKAMDMINKHIQFYNKGVGDDKPIEVIVTRTRTA